MKSLKLLKINVKKYKLKLVESLEFKNHCDWLDVTYTVRIKSQVTPKLDVNLLATNIVSERSYEA